MSQDTLAQWCERRTCEPPPLTQSCRRFSKLSKTLVRRALLLFIAAISSPRYCLSSLIVLGFLAFIVSLRVPQRKKSGGVRSGDLAGQWTSQWREMNRSLNAFRNISMVACAVCAGAPSCWNTTTLINYFRCRSGRRWSRSMAWYASAVTEPLK